MLKLHGRLIDFTWLVVLENTSFCLDQSAYADFISFFCGSLCLAGFEPRVLPIDAGVACADCLHKLLRKTASFAGVAGSLSKLGVGLVPLLLIRPLRRVKDAGQE
jgi:hypothetical protein